MGVPELVHSTQQHLSNAMWHPSSPHRQRHTTALQSQRGALAGGPVPSSKKTQDSSGPRDLQFPCTSALLSFQKTYHILISSMMRECCFYPRSRRGEKTGICQNRTRECWLCTFLPEHKDSANAEQVFTLNSQTTANARHETETGQGQLYFKARSKLNFLSRLNFLSWAKSLGSLMLTITYV